MNMSSEGLILAAESAIDLHLHTTYSDGRWTVGSLLDHLHQEQFGLAAIADHDRADTVAAIQQQALENQLPVLVAVEMTTTWRGELTDLLCYGFDPGHNALDDIAQDLLRRQQENTREVYENIQRKGYMFPHDVLPLVLSQPSSQQPHALVALLQEHGEGLDGPSVGKILMDAGCKFETNIPEVVVDAAHRSGGVCLLAHPGRGDGFKTYNVPLLDQFRQEAPIDGIEVHYPIHSAAQIAMYQAYVQRHHMLTSAGSDSHGPEKPPIKYRAELCRELLERVGIRIE